MTVCCYIVDRILFFFHAVNIILKRYRLLDTFALRARKSKKLSNGFSVARIFRDAFFEHPAEFFPERLVFFRILTGDSLQFIQQFSCCTCPNPFNLLVLLQKLAGHIQRKIIRVDYTSNKSKIARQKIFGVIHDEDSPNIQFDSLLAVNVKQIEWSLRRNVKQRRIFQSSFDSIVQPDQRFSRVE